jgi:hypothetical protein
MTWDELRQIALSFPLVEEATSYGTPSFKVKGKFLTRLRPEDDSLVLVDVPIDERDMLIEADPAVYHTTPHYKDYPAVLARMETIHPGSLRAFLERRWRNVAPKAAVKAFDAAGAERPASETRAP